MNGVVVTILPSTAAQIVGGMMSDRVFNIGFPFMAIIILVCLFLEAPSWMMIFIPISIFGWICFYEWENRTKVVRE